MPPELKLMGLVCSVGIVIYFVLLYLARHDTRER